MILILLITALLIELICLILHFYTHFRLQFCHRYPMPLLRYIFHQCCIYCTLRTNTHGDMNKRDIVSSMNTTSKETSNEKHSEMKRNENVKTIATQIMIPSVSPVSPTECTPSVYKVLQITPNDCKTESDLSLNISSIEIEPNDQHMKFNLFSSSSSANSPTISNISSKFSTNRQSSMRSENTFNEEIDTFSIKVNFVHVLKKYNNIFE